MDQEVGGRRQQIERTRPPISYLPASHDTAFHGERDRDAADIVGKELDRLLVRRFDARDESVAPDGHLLRLDRNAQAHGCLHHGCMDLGLWLVARKDRNLLRRILELIKRPCGHAGPRGG